MNERLQLLIKYLTALAGVQASGIKVRDEILQTIKRLRERLREMKRIRAKLKQVSAVSVMRQKQLSYSAVMRRVKQDIRISVTSVGSSTEERTVNTLDNVLTHMPLKPDKLNRW